MRLHVLLLLVLPAGGCGNNLCDPSSGACGQGEDAATAERVDNDGDAWLADEDCDDSNPDVHPGAEEVCDGIDNDCDGDVDEEPGAPSTW